MTRRRDTGLGGALLVASLLTGLACGGSGGAGGPAVADAGALAEDFVADLAAGAWNAAFSRLHPDLQAECGSAERLAAVVEAAGERPAEWELREPTGRPSGAQVTGTVTTTGGTPGIVEMTLIPAGEEWKVRFWSASNRELCSETEEAGG